MRDIEKRLKVLRWLMEGKRVYSDGWSDDEYIYLKKDTGEIYNEDDQIQTYNSILVGSHDPDQFYLKEEESIVTKLEYRIAFLEDKLRKVHEHAVDCQTILENSF